MIETIEITTPDDKPHEFIAAFQESSCITIYGHGCTPVSAVLGLMENLSEARSLLGARREQLAPQLRDEYNAIEAFLDTFLGNHETSADTE